MRSPVLQGRLIKGMERGIFGWSISNILFATSAIAIINAAIFQYFVLSALSSKFQKAYEGEVGAKLVAQVSGYRPRILRALQSQNPQSLQQVAADTLALDSGYQLVLFYDARGKFLSFFQRENVPLELVKSLSQVAKLQVLKLSSEGDSAPAIDILKAREQRTIDVGLPMDLKAEFSASGQGARIGFVRVLASLEKVDEKLLQLRLMGSILVIFTTALSTLLLFFVIRKSVTGPIERAVAMMESVVANVDKVPRLEMRDTDALQVKQLMKVLHAGLCEISIRQRSQLLFEKTRKEIESNDEVALLAALKKIWMGSKLVLNCQLVFARKTESGAYSMEYGTLSESNAEESGKLNDAVGGVKRATQVLDLQKDLVVEAVSRFLSRELEMDWSEQWLLAKIPMQFLNDEALLVLAIIPNELSGLTPDKFEELSHSWLTEVARVHQVAKYRSLTGEIEISRELHRKRVTFYPVREDDDGSAFEMVAACDSHGGTKGLGDFVFISNMASGMVTLSVLGTVGGQDFRAGLAASGVIAAIADRFQLLRGGDHQRVMKGVAASINHYLWETYHGNMSATTTIIILDHISGLGSFVCYGSRYPFLLTPMERKPMLIAQSDSCSALGISEGFSFAATSFPVIPGQIVFAATEGALDLENDAHVRVEKFLMGGGISEIVDLSYKELPKVVIQRVLESVRKYGGSQAAVTEMTGIVLMRDATS